MSFCWYLGGRIVNLDLAVAVFMAWSMFAYILGVNEVDKFKRNIYLYGIYVGSAFAILTKGFIGVVLPGAVFFLHILLTNNWKLVLRLNIPTGIILFLAITLPWHIYQYCF
jgi:4-amino-4-deoxy-L-arabinose transferase-like glycosyltransferase